MRVSRPLCADGKSPISHFLNKFCHTADMIELVNGYTEAADLVELLSALKMEIRLPIITKAWAA